MGALQPWHIVVVALVFVILFGSQRLPDAARGIGRSLRVFKSEVAELHDADRGDSEKTSGAIAPAIERESTERQ